MGTDDVATMPKLLERITQLAELVEENLTETRAVRTIVERVADRQLEIEARLGKLERDDAQAGNGASP